MKTLIVYYSYTSNNEKLALHLRKQLNCDIVKLETVAKRSGFSILLDLMFKRKPALKPVPYYLKDYNEIIFIGPVWAGKVATPLKSFMIREKDNINTYSFITICGGSPGQKENISRELRSTLGQGPANVIELWINDLLPKENKNSVKHTSGYRIETNELNQFDQLNEFVNVRLADTEPVTT